MASQRLTVTATISAFLRSLTGGSAAAALGVPTNAELAAAIEEKAVRYDATQAKTADQKQQARVNMFSMQDLRPGRTLSDNAAVLSTDFGTFVSLAGYTLSPGAVRAGGILGVQGPGTVTPESYDAVVLVAEESALVFCLASGDTRVTAVSRIAAPKITAAATAPSNPSAGDKWTDTTTLQTFVYYDGYWVEEIGIPTVPVLPARTISTATGAFVTNDLNGYIRCVYDAADNVTKILTVPAPGGSFTPVEGGLYTFRTRGKEISRWRPRQWRSP